MGRILIVEDEPDIVLSLQEDLERQGHETGVATDGPEGFEAARRGAWDLILLDVMLPKMDGFDVCNQLRKAGVTTPIILLTARAGSGERARARFRRGRLRDQTLQPARTARANKGSAAA